MLDIIWEKIKKVVTSRLFPITIIYMVLFSFIIHRLFVLQIVEGPVHAEEFNLKKTRNREIKSTRGNIYDRNGKLLASNMLSYSVMMEDSTEIKSNEQRNAIIHKLINIIEGNGDTLDNEFYIIQNSKGEFEFTVSGSALTRFKKNVYAYTLDNNELTEEQKNATAAEVYEYLRIGTGDGYTSMFGISEEYSVEETLKIMSIRYALFCNYPKYVQITVASNVSDITVAEVLENSAELVGVEIAKQTKRVYHDALYFSHILGYTGLISAEELAEKEKESDYYNSTDVIGKSGIEKEYEEYLSGTKGNETVSVNFYTGKVIDVVDRVDPIAGNDVYLTIDADLQKAAYHLLEKKIAGILKSKITPNLDYGSKGESASDILIPIYEVYYAFFNNNIINIDEFDDPDATQMERQVYGKYQSNLTSVLGQLNNLLSYDNEITNQKAGDMEDYLKYFYNVLTSNKILLTNAIPEDDSSFKDYKNNKISLSAFIRYALANNWIDLSKLSVGNEYLTSEELYYKLINHTVNLMKNDDNFVKRIYRNLIFSYNLTGKEICILLSDQNVIEYNEEEINRLLNNQVSAYNYIIDKLTKLEITPAMLALEPCSGSVVVTDVQTGDVLALVSYPSYDNNKMANKVDADYYNFLRLNKTYPLVNRPLQEAFAPGSTFKMLTAFAALEEGVITPSDKVLDLGEFDKTDIPAKCHIYPRSHGHVDLVHALKVSCNYYFYEMGWRLGMDSSGRVRDQLGLERLAKYAAMFGLNTTSGIELYEDNPHVSNRDAIRSAIGQGSHAYTPIQLARYVTTLANRGTVYNFTILDKIVDKDGKEILNNQATILNDLTDTNPSTWDAILEGMYSVVNEKGGSSYNTYKDLGIKVAGKTGTSQLSKSSPNNALFVSFAPYEEPKVSVTTVIPNGYTSHNSAEVTRDVYKYYFGLEDEEELLESEVTIPESSAIEAYIE